VLVWGDGKTFSGQSGEKFELVPSSLVVECKKRSSELFLLGAKIIHKHEEVGEEEKSFCLIFLSQLDELMKHRKKRRENICVDSLGLSRWGRLGSPARSSASQGAECLLQLCAPSRRRRRRCLQAMRGVSMSYC
jgi:hypothetical protein